MLSRFAAAFVALTAVLGAALAAPRPPIPVLLLDGESGGPWHDWRLTTPVLKKELEESGRFAVTVMSAPKSGGDFGAFHPDFARYRVVVSNLDSAEWPAALKEQFEAYMRGGGGFVAVHAADNAFPGWPDYNRMIGIGGWRGRNESAGPYWYFLNGKLVSDPAPGEAGKHGKRLPFLVTARAPDHPILRGLPKVWMHAPDELYGRLRGPGGMTVLATAHSEPANSGSGFDEPMLMVARYGKGRIFHTTLGHDVAAMACVGFIVTLQRGTEWAATGTVTQKPPKTFPTADTIGIRADIAAMDPVYYEGADRPPPAKPAH
jgi:uncharacterized protein